MMMTQGWLTMTMADLGRGIEAGDICPVALTDTYLAAINAHPLRDKIYSQVTETRAKSEAAAAKRRADARTRLSVLDGVPISWKDLFDTADIPTEAGSALLAGRVPQDDAEVVANATAMGLVCLGKTHMSELAFSGLGYNPITETPPCVNDETAVAGGSSSGAATSVAFHLAACGIGSDTGGSVRIPAAWNDLVGLKTTAARVSLEGVVPLCESFDTVGPLCRSVEDATLMLAALEGEKPADLRGVQLSGCRFAILKSVAFDDIREAPLAGFELCVSKLRAAGVEVEEIEIPELQEAMDLSGILFTTEAYAQWRDVIEATPDKMFPEILDRFRAGSQHKGVDYIAAWDKLMVVRDIYAQKVAGFDGVLIPSSPILSPNLDRLATDHGYYVSENLLALRNTRIGNLMGLPAVTIPTGVPSCGMMVMGQPFGEEHLLRVCHGVEGALT
ncbi:MAG: amidase [Halocynthiibacter sp.]